MNGRSRIEPGAPWKRRRGRSRWPFEVVEVGDAREVVGGVLLGGIRIIAGVGRWVCCSIAAVVVVFIRSLLFTLHTTHCWADPVEQRERSTGNVRIRRNTAKKENFPVSPVMGWLGVNGETHSKVKCICLNWFIYCA